MNENISEIESKYEEIKQLVSEIKSDTSKLLLLIEKFYGIIHECVVATIISGDDLDEISGINDLIDTELNLLKLDKDMLFILKKALDELQY